MEPNLIGLVISAAGRTGVLHQLTGVIARHEGDITSVEILRNWPAEARTYFEVMVPGSPEQLVKERLQAGWRKLSTVNTKYIVMQSRCKSPGLRFVKNLFGIQCIL